MMAATGAKLPSIRFESPDLRSCPFCGGPAELTVTDGEHFASCGAVNDCQVYVVAGGYPTAAEAAAAWNHRVWDGGEEDAANGYA